MSLEQKIKEAKQGYTNLLKQVKPDIFPGPSVKELDQARNRWIDTCKKLGEK